jgi:hypothetical protein
MGATRSIRNLGNPRLWNQRARVRRARLSASLQLERVRDIANATRERWKISWSLACQMLLPLFISVGVFVLVEGGATVIRRFESPEVAPFVLRVTSGSYETLVSAGVGAIATFLGLYFATVGVVASTVYGAVPPGVRALFVQEPNGVVYIRGVAYALVFGLLILASGALGYRPSPLGIAFFSLFATVSVLRLLILGARVFNFFDPSALSAPLMKRFVAAARLASTAPGSLNPASQVTANDRARAVLDLYRHLAVLLEDGRARDASGSNRLTNQVLRLVSWYSTVKYRIPPGSAWWVRQPEHPNWLTAGYFDLNIALSTATGLRPKLAANPLWVEMAAADILQRTLASAYRARGSAGALRFAESVANVINHLSSRLQVDEAMVMETVWSTSIREMTSAVPDGTNQLTPQETELNQLAAAEQVVMPMIEAWLGFTRAAKDLAHQDLPAAITRALRNRSEMYRVALPAPSVKVLEEFAKKIDVEIEVEGRRVTPNWWLNHFIARSVATHLKASHDAIVNSIDARIEPIIQEFADNGRQDLASVAALSALELVHKIDAHQSTVRDAFDALSKHRSVNVSVDYWPETPNDNARVQRLRATLNRHLVIALPALRGGAFDKASPDIYGQSYQFVTYATFEEILEGDSDLALDLIRAMLGEVAAVRERVKWDLAEHSLEARAAHSVEPIVAVMELSGYACLMSEITGAGIWPEVRKLWDEFLADHEDGSMAAFLITAAQIAEDHMSFSPGSMGRSMRSQRVRQTLAERGIRGGRTARFEAPSAVSSPIISVFVLGDYGGHEVIADLFIAEYLLPRLPRDTKLPTRTKAAVKALAVERTKFSNTAPQAEVPNPSREAPDLGEAPDV